MKLRGAKGITGIFSTQKLASHKKSTGFYFRILAENGLQGQEIFIMLILFINIILTKGPLAFLMSTNSEAIKADVSSDLCRLTCEKPPGYKTRKSLFQASNPFIHHRLRDYKLKVSKVPNYFQASRTLIPGASKHG